MSEITGPTESRPERAAPQEYCAYCGARLNPSYYFCASCATPYKNVESVLPRVRLERPTTGQLIEHKAPHVWSLFWTYMAVVVAVAILSLLLLRDARPDIMLFFLEAALFVTTSVFAAIHWRSLAVQFKRLGLFKPAALLGICALAPLLAVNYYYHGWLTESLGVEKGDLIARLRESGMDWPAVIVFFCVFPAVLEEIAFRGLVQHWLHVAVRPLVAIALASALFTALHLSILSAPYIFAVGMVLGFTKYKTGSLYPAMLIHFLHNLLVLTVIAG